MPPRRRSGRSWARSGAPTHGRSPPRGCQPRNLPEAAAVSRSTRMRPAPEPVSGGASLGQRSAIGQDDAEPWSLVDPPNAIPLAAAKLSIEQRIALLHWGPSRRVQRNALLRLALPADKRLTLRPVMLPALPAWTTERRAPWGRARAYRSRCFKLRGLALKLAASSGARRRSVGSPQRA